MAKQKFANIGNAEDVITGGVILADITASGATAEYFLKIDAGGTVLVWSLGTGAGANDLGELTDVAATIGTQSGKLLIGQGSVYDDKAVTGDVTIDLDGVTTIGALKVVNGMIGANEVILGKLGNGAVDLAAMAANAIHPTALIQTFQALLNSCAAPSLGAEAANQIEATYTLSDVGGGGIGVDDGSLIEIVVSDSATDPEPSDDTTLEQGTGSLLLTGAGTAQAVCSLSAAGLFIFKVSHSAGAGTKYLWLRAAHGCPTWFRHSSGPNDAVVFA